MKIIVKQPAQLDTREQKNLNERSYFSRETTRCPMLEETSNEQTNKKYRRKKGRNGKRTTVATAITYRIYSTRTRILYGYGTHT